MAEIYRLHGNSHEDVQAILPWYVNQTLAADEASRVEAHLADCQECRSDLEAERILARGVKALPMSAEHGWSEMKRRISPPGSRERAGRVAFLRRKVGLGWAIAAPLAAAASVGLMFTFVPVGTPSEHIYHALGSPTPDKGANLVVMFRPDATAEQIGALLTANHARLVDGPTAGGGFLLRVEGAGRPSALRRLRQSSQIVLAEPIDQTGP
jgi:hypothetical protein